MDRVVRAELEQLELEIAALRRAAFRSGADSWGHPRAHGDADHITAGAAHNAVTLAADAQELLNLAVQEIGFVAKAANIVLAGPAAGGAADPTFRALVLADISGAALGAGAPDGTKYLRDDRTWQTPAGGGGDVVGPGAATDNAFARFHLATGKIIQNSVAICDDAGNVSGLTTIAVGNTPSTSGTVRIPAGGTIHARNVGDTGNLLLLTPGADDHAHLGAATVPVIADGPMEYKKMTTANIDANDEIVVPTTSWVYVTCAGASDNLLGIGAGDEGQEIWLTPAAGKDITLIHNSGATVAGQPLMINGEANVTLDQDHDMALARYDATAGVWNVMVPGSGGGGGSGSMTTVKEYGTQVGGADIVTLDFDQVFNINESPDTEINISLHEKLWWIDGIIGV
jgi:hypothetical protein